MKSKVYEVPGLLAGLMDTDIPEKMAGLIDPTVLKKIRNVILTGCGPQRYAAEAAKPVYENKKNFKGTGMFPGVEVYPMSTVDFARYYCTYRGWHPQRKDKHLVIAADSEGRDPYSAECMKRANEFGSPSVAITSGGENELAAQAAYVVSADAKDNFVYEFSMQVYLTTLLGLRLSVAKGFLTEEQEAGIRKQLRDYTEAFGTEVLEEMDGTVRAAADKWRLKGINMVQFAGSSQDLAVAGWGSSVFMKYGGMCTSLDDLEGWCHVDIFTAPNDRIGCVVVISSESMAASRAKEVVEVMRSLGREVLVVTDGDLEVEESADVVRLPKCGYEFGAPLLQQLPIALLLAYMIQE